MRTVIEDGHEVHDPECTGCAHDCVWKRLNWGGAWCQPCDDHYEAQHAEAE